MLKGSFHQKSIPDKVNREDRPVGEESSVKVTVFKLVFHIVYFKLNTRRKFECSCQQNRSMTPANKRWQQQ